MTRPFSRPIVTCAFFFAVIGLAVVLIPEIFGHGKTKDYPLWYRTGMAFWRPGPLYIYGKSGQLNFLYSPFAAMVFAMLSPLGKVPLYTAIVCATAAAWAWCVRLSVDLSGGSRTSAFLVVAPFFLLFPLVFNNFDNGQPNLILLALTLSALSLDYKGRWVTAGSLLGTAAAFKLFPIAVVLYWIVRGRLKAAGFAVLVCLALILVAPSLVRGPSLTAQDVATWWPAMSTVDETLLAQRRENWGYKNQSLYVLVHRMLRPVDTQVRRDGAPWWRTAPMTINFLSLDFETTNRVFLLLAAMLGLSFVGLLRTLDPDDPRQEVRAWAVLICLTTVANPLARDYYFVWLLMPVTVLLQGILEHRGTAVARRSTVLLVVAFGLMALSFDGVPKVFEAYGNMLFATALIAIAAVLQALAFTGNRDWSLEGPATLRAS